MQGMKRHLNLLGMIPLFLFFKSCSKISLMNPEFLDWSKSRIFGLSLWIGSILLVLVGKGMHILNHNYYLFAACWISLIFIYLEVQNWSFGKRNLFLSFYILIGISGTFHQWRVPQPFLGNLIAEEIQKKHIPENAKIAVYISDNPQFLYWAHRTGWVLFEKDFQGPESCPQGADYYLLRRGLDQIVIEPCLNVDRK